MALERGDSPLDDLRLAAALAAADPFEPVLVEEDILPCNVYTCRLGHPLGVNETNSSTLYLYKDDSGDVFARLKCFLFLDDFDEYGCREWDRLDLNRERTDKLYDCQMPYDIPPTPVWENEIKNRRSKLECEGRVPGFSLPPP